MKIEHVKDDHEALLDYLYEEGDPAERLKIAQHLQTCAACSVAVVELQAVRGVLSDWTPPPAALGFKVVREDVGRRQPFWLPSLRPAWAQLAAAIVIFATGFVVSQLTVDYGNGAVTVRARSVPSQSRAAVEPADVIASGRQAIAVPRPAAEAVSPIVPPLEAGRRAGTKTPTLEDLQRLVRMEIEESETRQQRQVALLLSQFAREYDIQRVADLRRFEQTLGQFEGQAGAEIQQQRQLLEMLVRTSGQPR